ISLWANGGENSTNGEGNLLAQNNYLDTSLNSTLDQEINVKNNGWNLNSSLNYTEPLSKKSAMEVRYRLGFQNNSSNKNTFNYNDGTGSYSIQDTQLSSNFTSQ